MINTHKYTENTYLAIHKTKPIHKYLYINIYAYINIKPKIYIQTHSSKSGGFKRETFII